jgi:uncharacterized protein (DUF1778 family)
MTAFVLENSLKAAREVTEQKVLSVSAQLKLIEALRNPPEPTEALKELFALGGFSESR